MTPLWYIHTANPKHSTQPAPAPPPPTPSRQMPDGKEVAIIQIIITPYTPTTIMALLIPII